MHARVWQGFVCNGCSKWWRLWGCIVGVLCNEVVIVATRRLCVSVHDPFNVARHHKQTTLGLPHALLALCYCSFYVSRLYRSNARIASCYG